MAGVPNFLGTPKLGLARIQNSDGTNGVTVVTGGSNGSKIAGLLLTSSDSVQRNVQAKLFRSAVAYELGSVLVPPNSGWTNDTPPVDLLGNLVGLPIDQDGQRYMLLQSGDTLQINVIVAVTGGTLIWAVAPYGDF